MHICRYTYFCHLKSLFSFHPFVSLLMSLECLTWKGWMSSLCRQRCDLERKVQAGLIWWTGPVSAVSVQYLVCVEVMVVICSNWVLFAHDLMKVNTLEGHAYDNICVLLPLDCCRDLVNWSTKIPHSKAKRISSDTNKWLLSHCENTALSLCQI